MAQVGFVHVFQVKCTPIVKRRSGFYPRSVHVSFVVERVALGQGFFEYCRFPFCILLHRRSQWPRGLRRRSAAVRLLRSWVRVPRGVWMFVCCECCVMSGRGLCDELITRPEESYRLLCVIVCDLGTSRMRRPWPALGRSATGKRKKIYIITPVLHNHLHLQVSLT